MRAELGASCIYLALARQAEQARGSATKIKGASKAGGAAWKELVTAIVSSEPDFESGTSNVLYLDRKVGMA